MTAPVVGFTAEVDKGLSGPTRIDVELDDMTPCHIEITLVDYPLGVISSERTLIINHDEARQIIAGLASVIE